MKKKDEVKEYLNKNSKRVFIVMLILLGISVVIAMYKGMTRESVDFKAGDIMKETNGNFNSDVRTLEYSVQRYSTLKDKERELDLLLDKDTLSVADTLKLKKLLDEIKMMK